MNMNEHYERYSVHQCTSMDIFSFYYERRVPSMILKMLENYLINLLKPDIFL